MNIASRISDASVIPGLRVLTAKTGANDIVTVYGSMLGGHSFGPQDNPMVPEMTVMMLDEGTTSRTKEEIHDLLESVGASLHFSCFNHDIGFSIQCLTKDIPMVLELLAEQLGEPAFKPDNLAIEKKRAIGDLTRSKDDTGQQSEIVLSQALFPKEHPNFDESIDTVIEQIRSITSEDLKAFHLASYGLGSLTIVATGDIQPEVFESQVSTAFSGWKKSPLLRGEQKERGNKTSKELKILSMADKASVDVSMGQALGITRSHPDFYALSLGNEVLGGRGFSARLMGSVRDRQGLTYGVYSGIGGVREGDDGYWYVTATFAPELLKKGIVAVEAEIQTWYSKGITAKELAFSQDKITGSFKVGLATTRGLGSAILNVIELGKPKEFLDEYPQVIRELTLAQVNGAIRNHINPDKVVTVAAGSVDGQGNPLEK